MSRVSNRLGNTFFTISYGYASESGSSSCAGVVTYNTKSVSQAMRRFFAEKGGEKDYDGRYICPIAVKANKLA